MKSLSQRLLFRIGFVVIIFSTLVGIGAIGLAGSERLQNSLHNPINTAQTEIQNENTHIVTDLDPTAKWIADHESFQDSGSFEGLPEWSQEDIIEEASPAPQASLIEPIAADAFSVTSPSSSTTFTLGQYSGGVGTFDMVVRWTDQSYFGSYVHIYLQYEDNVIDTKPNEANDGYYSGSFLFTGCGTKWRIKIVATTDSNQYGYSDYFTVEYYGGWDCDGDIEVTGPEEDSTYYPGDTVPITWTSSGFTSIDIDLYDNYGSQPEAIASNVADTGSYSWEIPEDIDTNRNYRVRIMDGNREHTYSTGEYFSVNPAPDEATLATSKVIGKYIIFDIDNFEYNGKMVEQMQIKVNSHSSTQASGEFVYKYTDNSVENVGTYTATMYCKPLNELQNWENHANEIKTYCGAPTGGTTGCWECENCEYTSWYYYYYIGGNQKVVEHDATSGQSSWIERAYFTAIMTYPGVMFYYKGEGPIVEDNGGDFTIDFRTVSSTNSLEKTSSSGGSSNSDDDDFFSSAIDFIGENPEIAIGGGVGGVVLLAVVAGVASSAKKKKHSTDPNTSSSSLTPKTARSVKEKKSYKKSKPVKREKKKTLSSKEASVTSSPRTSITVENSHPSSQAGIQEMHMEESLMDGQEIIYDGGDMTYKPQSNSNLASRPNRTSSYETSYEKNRRVAQVLSGKDKKEDQKITLTGNSANTFKPSTTPTTKTTISPSPQSIPPIENKKQKTAGPSGELMGATGAMSGEVNGIVDSEIFENLSNLKELFDMGILSEDEYNTKKKELLKRL